MASENGATKEDCGIIIACDKGDDDSQVEYLE
jgi:hypothetical protein